jgi:hypothetical protein
MAPAAPLFSGHEPDVLEDLNVVRSSGIAEDLVAGPCEGPRRSNFVERRGPSHGPDHWSAPHPCQGCSLTYPTHYRGSGEQRSEQRRENPMTTSTQETTRLTGDPAVCSTDWLCVSALLLMTVGVATIWIGAVEQEIALNILGCAVQWGAGWFILGRISKRHQQFSFWVRPGV